MQEDTNSLDALWGRGHDMFAPYGGGEAYLRQERASWIAAESCRNNPFKLHPKAEKRRKSAATLVKVILANRSAEILDEHRSELLSVLLWKMTEADSPKHRTRFQSACAIALRDSTPLRHEHVYQRSKMIQALWTASSEQVDVILNSAVACTVTREEHDRLAKYDDDYGWERYRKAHIEVIDTATGEIVDLGN